MLKLPGPASMASVASSQLRRTATRCRCSIDTIMQVMVTSLQISLGGENVLSAAGCHTAMAEAAPVCRTALRCASAPVARRNDAGT